MNSYATASCAVIVSWPISSLLAGFINRLSRLRLVGTYARVPALHIDLLALSQNVQAASSAKDRTRSASASCWSSSNRQSQGAHRRMLDQPLHPGSCIGLKLPGSV